MQPYHTKRSHSRTCSGACRLALYKLERNFTLIAKQVPEGEEEKYFELTQCYDEETGKGCHLHLRWYKITTGRQVKRFCDIYVIKENCDIEALFNKLGCIKKKRGSSTTEFIRKPDLKFRIVP
jgi:hypothetical protein